MNFISKILRFIEGRIAQICSTARIIRLKLLYPGITIDFKSTIEGKCSIICIKGGRLHISNSKISFGTNIIADEGSQLSIENAFIGRNCVITSKEKISIKKGCLIAEMVVIRDQDHTWTGNEEISKERFTTAPIEVAENVWIASKATILKGVSIGKNSVIAASAVIKMNVGTFEMWGGVPAKFIKNIESPGQ